MKQYDYLIVGAGLFGAVFAHEAHKAGKRCLVIDRRPHLGGNVYCEQVEGINVHRYGAHIFHTANKRVWEYVNALVEFNRYTNCPVARYKDEMYNLPFNMNTFNRMWSVKTPDEATAKIEEQKAEAVERMKAEGVTEPRNLEEQALMLVGKDIYERLIKGYTEKPSYAVCLYDSCLTTTTSTTLTRVSLSGDTTAWWSVCSMAWKRALAWTLLNCAILGTKWLTVWSIRAQSMSTSATATATCSTARSISRPR